MIRFYQKFENNAIKKIEYKTRFKIKTSSKARNLQNRYRRRLIGGRTPLHFRLTIVYHNSRKTSTKKIKKIEHRLDVAPSKIRNFYLVNPFYHSSKTKSTSKTIFKFLETLANFFDYFQKFENNSQSLIKQKKTNRSSFPRIEYHPTLDMTV